MKFALFGNTYQAKKSAHVIRLLSILKQYNAVVYINREFYHFLVDEQKMDIQAAGVFEGNDFEADMVLSMGGDGTFLRAASYVGNKNIPILGINTGRLGFLADVSPEEMEDTFKDIYNHNYKVEDRSVLQVISNGQSLKGYPCGLNEIAILKRDSSSMITIHTSINGAYLTTYQADGLVIATPTGSTAYSLSVGGPIVTPEAGVFVISPIAPHNLNVRPLIVPQDAVIDMKISSRADEVMLTVDNRELIIPSTSTICLSRGDFSMKTVSLKKEGFFQALQEKLLWGADKRNNL